MAKTLTLDVSLKVLKFSHTLDVYEISLKFGRMIKVQHFYSTLSDLDLTQGRRCARKWKLLGQFFI